MAITASEFLQWAIAFGIYPPNQASGSVTQVDTGTGLIGGPITTTGEISFAPIAANSFWANTTGGAAVPTVTSLSAFPSSTLPSGEIYVGNASNVATAVALSGDGALSNAGALTISSIGGHAVILAAAFTTSGANALTLTTTGVTNATLPVGTTTLVPTTGTGATGVWSGITGLGNQSQALNMNSQLINNVATPLAAGDAVNKQYADNIAAGFNPIEAVQAATTPAGGDLGATYNNGSSGVGATLTNAGAQVAFAVDGYSASVGDRILVKNQTAPAQNGIYSVTTLGSGSTNWVLTRPSDYNSSTNIQRGDLTAIENGTVNAGASWYQTQTVTTVGTDAISFSVFFSPANFISSSLTSAHILVGNASNIATNVAMSGQATISNTGALSLVANTVTNSNLAQMAANTIKGNNTGSTANAADLTRSQVIAMLQPITQINIIPFASSGNYTPTAGLIQATFEGVAGGGAGGGATSTTGNAASGGGGGAGQYGRKTLTAAAIGAGPVAVVIGAAGSPGAAGNNPGGAGGDTTFGGTLAVFKGGAGGNPGSAGNSGTGNVGGSGGTTDIPAVGQSGTTGFGQPAATANNFSAAGIGGSTLWGAGGNTGTLQISAPGIPGSGPGAGGGGAISWNGVSANQAGGPGYQGFALITEYISA